MILFRNIFIVIAAVCFSHATAFAQLSETYVNVFQAIDTTHADGDIVLHIGGETFLKNDEYFSDYIEGYTLVGYQLRPTLAAYIRKNIVLEAGARIRQYGGTTRTDNVCPIVTAQWQINPTWNLTMGMIDGHLAHRLPETMWEPERQFTDKPEMGIQVKFNRRHLDGELWLNWQQFIKRGDTIPEKFTFGLRADIMPSDANSQWGIEIPVRLLVSHVGGQISDFSERMQSLANGSLSLVIARKWHGSYMRKVYVDINAQFFHAMVDGGVRPFSDGSALFPKIGLQTKNIGASVGFWNARNFFSLYGNPTFMSLSNYKSDVYAKRRSLLTAEADFFHSISDILRFAIGGKMYLDTRASQLDYSYHADLVLTPSWTFRKK
ncbi:MAG: hypothetical protein MJZ01_07595 [Bacteroidales bacterium]|nr:hypothetical protein [Bacteroidales bacterium]